jgi:hypothetical protein
MNKSILEKLSSIDRRIIYLIIGVVVIVPFFIPMSLPIYVSPPVQSVYDYIESLPEGSVVVIGFSFGPATMPELYPMCLAVLRHCYSRNLKVIGITLHSEGATIADNAMRLVAEEYDYKEHENYTYLGFKVQPVAVILGIGEDISIPFPNDYTGTPISKIPMMKDIRNYNDIDLIVDFGSGNSPEWWVTYAGSKYHEKIASGCTGVMVSGLYPYLNTGQLIGIIGGLKGAAEYEKLINQMGKATLGMKVQSVVHVAIVLMVIFGNVVYLLLLRQKRREEASA